MTTNLKPCAAAPLPCPWCNRLPSIRIAKLDPQPELWCFTVRCINNDCVCRPCSACKNNEADAVAAWNTRADDREAIAAAVSAERRRIVAALRAEANKYPGYIDKLGEMGDRQGQLAGMYQWQALDHTADVIEQGGEP